MDWKVKWGSSKYGINISHSWAYSWVGTIQGPKLLSVCEWSHVGKEDGDISSIPPKLSHLDWFG